MRMIYNDPWTRNRITEPWVYWDDGFSKEELDRLIEFCSKLELEEAKTYEEGESKARRSKVAFVKYDDESSWIFKLLNGILTNANNQFYEFDINGYPVFQYTEYHEEDNGYYDWHMDMSLGHDKGNFGETRKLSLTLCLNDGYEGGEFLINNSSESTPIVVPSKVGRAIIFPAWMLHTVKPVTKGTRKSIVVWCMGPKFK